MEKRTKVIYIIVTLILLTGIALISLNYYMDKDVKISSKIMNKLSDTDKIVIKSGKRIIGTVTEENVIEKVLLIMSEATIRINGAYTCDGTGISFEMYNGDKIIDSVYIWIRGNIMPKSKAKGCAKYTLPLKNNNDLNIIIEEQTGTRLFRLFSINDSSEECIEDLELLYEDEKYNYYYSCVGSEKILIEFITTKLKLPVKEALENNHISINELIQQYPNLFRKEIK